MRRSTKLAIPTTLALTVGLFPVLPAAAQVVCDGEISSETISDDLLVPRDGFCVLDDVVVSGDLVIGRNADVYIVGSQILGDLEVGFDADVYLTDSEVSGEALVRQNAFADLLGTTIDGNATLERSFGLYAQDSQVAGDVLSSRAELLWTVGSHVGGDLDVDRRTEVFVDAGWVAGDLIGSNARYVDLLDSVVEGRLTVTGAEQGVLICESEVDGDVSLGGSQQVIQIGATGPLGSCGHNVFGAGVAIADNRGVTLVSHNVVRGDLSCDGNDPAPRGEDNRVRGEATGQCADLLPPATVGARTLAAPQDEASADDRRVDAEARLDERRDGAEGRAQERSADSEDVGEIVDRGDRRARLEDRDRSR